MTELFRGEDLSRCSDAEVMQAVDSALERVYRTEKELQRVMGYATLRGLIRNIPADAEFGGNVIPFPGRFRDDDEGA